MPVLYTYMWATFGFSDYLSGTCFVLLPSVKTPHFRNCAVIFLIIRACHPFNAWIIPYY